MKRADHIAATRTHTDRAQPCLRVAGPSFHLTRSFYITVDHFNVTTDLNSFDVTYRGPVVFG